MKLPHFTVFAAFFLSPGAEKQPVAPVTAPTNLAVMAAVPEVLPMGPVVHPSEDRIETKVVAPEVPADLRVIVNAKAGIKIMTLVHQGHLVTLRRGDAVVLGDNSVSVPIKEAGPMKWESLERKTFETLRGIVEWDEHVGKSPTPRLVATERISPMRTISSARHECKAFDVMNEVVTVFCRIDSIGVGAVRVFGDKPQAGISMAETGAATGELRYFRMDLDTRKNDFDAVVIGYSDGVRGHVIRAESSKLPGETKASFSLLAAARAQPIPIRRFFHHHRHDFEPFL